MNANKLFIIFFPKIGPVTCPKMLPNHFPCDTLEFITQISVLIIPNLPLGSHSLKSPHNFSTGIYLFFHSFYLHLHTLANLRFSAPRLLRARHFIDFRVVFSILLLLIVLSCSLHHKPKKGKLCETSNQEIGYANTSATEV